MIYNIWHIDIVIKEGEGGGVLPSGESIILYLNCMLLNHVLMICK
jgi:hypothetical protein